MLAMDEFEPRQLLLMQIRDKRCGGNSAELARRIVKDPTYVNRLFYPIGKTGRKGVGLEIMDSCNAVFDLPAGYWDGKAALPDLGQESSTGDEMLSLEVITALSQADPDERSRVEVVLRAMLKLPPQEDLGNNAGRQTAPPKSARA